MMHIKLMDWQAYFAAIGTMPIYVPIGGRTMKRTGTI